MTTAAQIAQHIHFEVTPPGAIAYTIDGGALQDSWRTIYIAFNGSAGAVDLALPSGEWRTALDDSATLHTGSLRLDGYSSVIMYEK